MSSQNHYRTIDLFLLTITLIVYIVYQVFNESVHIHCFDKSVDGQQGIMYVATMFVFIFMSSSITGLMEYIKRHADVIHGAECKISSFAMLSMLIMDAIILSSIVVLVLALSIPYPRYLLALIIGLICLFFCIMFRYLENRVFKPLSKVLAIIVSSLIITGFILLFILDLYSIFISRLLIIMALIISVKLLAEILFPSHGIKNNCIRIRESRTVATYVPT